MMSEQAELQGMGLVLLGDFNPKIFQPLWFAAQNLIRVKEAEEADIKIISAEAVIFSLDWVDIEVLRDRFTMKTIQEPYYDIVRDLCIGTFRLLKHTPIRKMGINRDFHYRMVSEEQLHALGHKLAPKPLWEGILKKPLLHTITMESSREDGLTGYIRVKVESSLKIRPGVYIHINDHYEVEDQAIIGCDKIVNILETYWAQSMERCKIISYNVKDW